MKSIVNIIRVLILLKLLIVLIISFPGIATIKATGTQAIGVFADNSTALIGGECEFCITAYSANDGCNVSAALLDIKFPNIISVKEIWQNGILLVENTDYSVSESENVKIIYEPDSAQMPAEVTWNFTLDISNTATEGVYNVVFGNKMMFSDSSANNIGLNLHTGSLRITDRKSFILGDLNSDAETDTLDLTIMRRSLLDINGFNDFFVSDVNSDGFFNIADLVCLKKQIAYNFRDIYISQSGSDLNDGSREKPLKSLNSAISAVSPNGKIHIIGIYKLNPFFVWNYSGNDVVIDGGILNCTDLEILKMGCNVKFENIELIFNDGQKIYASGNRLEIDSSVNVEGKPIAFGGSNRAVKSTEVKVFSGSYKTIYGGSDGASVEGNTMVSVGGNVNSDISEKDHGSGRFIFGGGYNDIVHGNTQVNFLDDAKACMIFGAGSTGSCVQGETTINFCGGKAMGLYGGSNSNGICYTTNINMSSGWVEQVFGGCESISMTGTTTVNIVGGTVNRRIYGGCYNNFENKQWIGNNHVVGYTTVIIDERANIDLSYRTKVKVAGIEVSVKADNSIYATSRYKSSFEDEIATFIFTSHTSDAIYNKTGYCDTLSRYGLGYDDYFSNLTNNYRINVGKGGNVKKEKNRVIVTPDAGKAVVINDSLGTQKYENTTEYLLPYVSDNSQTINISFEDKS